MKTLSLIVAAIVLSITIFIPMPALAQQVAQDQPKEAVKTSVPETKPIGVGLLAEVLRKHIPEDIPILPDISITPPDASVSHELARFSGAWIGRFQGQRTNTYMADQLYVFEKVLPTSVTMVSGGVGRFADGSDRNYGRTWSNRYELRPEGSQLTVTFPNGNRATFQIEGEYLSVQTRTWVGTFKKIQ